MGPWRCDVCLEDVPGNFDVCWNCGADQEGNVSDEFVAEPVEAGLADGPEDWEPELGKCDACGATAVMYGLSCSGASGGLDDGPLKVVVLGRPGALIFKDPYFGRVAADVCGDCGAMNLRVLNPRELLQHYYDSHGKAE
jgi:hypothetical protein